MAVAAIVRARVSCARKPKRGGGLAGASAGQSHTVESTRPQATPARALAHIYRRNRTVRPRISAAAPTITPDRSDAETMLRGLGGREKCPFSEIADFGKSLTVHILIVFFPPLHLILQWLLFIKFFKAQHFLCCLSFIFLRSTSLFLNRNAMSIKKKNFTMKNLVALDHIDNHRVIAAGT